MTRHRSTPSTAPTIPPGPADTHGHDLLSRAVMAATWYLEIRAGRRPVAHLHDWVSPPVARQLDGLVRRRRRKGPRGASAISLVRVWAQRQSGVAHVVVILREHHRTRPVAVAMETGVDHPRIIALGLPEDHVMTPTSSLAIPDGPASSVDAEPPCPSPPELLDVDGTDASHGDWAGTPGQGTRLVGSGTMALLELVP